MYNVQFATFSVYGATLPYRLLICNGIKQYKVLTTLHKNHLAQESLSAGPNVFKS